MKYNLSVGILDFSHPGILDIRNSSLSHSDNLAHGNHATVKTIGDLTVVTLYCTLCIVNVSSLFVGYLLLKAVVKKMPKSCCAVGCSNHNMMNPLFIPSLIISVKVNQFIVFYVSYDVESHVNCTFLFFKKNGAP